jgi:hypothetical protein
MQMEDHDCRCPSHPINFCFFQNLKDVTVLPVHKMASTTQNEGEARPGTEGGTLGSFSCADVLAYCWKLLLEQVLAVMPVCTFLALFQVAGVTRFTPGPAVARCAPHSMSAYCTHRAPA